MNSGYIMFMMAACLKKGHAQVATVHTQPKPAHQHSPHARAFESPVLQKLQVSALGKLLLKYSAKPAMLRDPNMQFLQTSMGASPDKHSEQV